MANTWVSSDLHFGHKRILEFCKDTRQWADIDEMTEGLIDHWNNTVKRNDTIYILGDFSFYTRAKTEAILQQLNGNKFLVFGNHDGVLREEWATKHFTHRSDLLRHKLFGQDIVMAHYPLLRWEKCHYGSLHLFGHEHGADVGDKGRCMDVGWDAHGKILNMEDVVTELLTKEILEHHGKTN